jgi:putative ABC transport system permease protein
MLDPIRAGVARVFTLGFRRPADAIRDADEELESHLIERAALLEARGYSPEEARAEARRRLGMPESGAREALRRSATRRERRASILEWLASWRADVGYVARGIRREPAFFAFVVLTLSLGIGANAAMFGVVDRLLLRGPAHVVDPGRVVRLFWTMRAPAGGDQTVATLDFTLYANILAESHAFSAIGQFSGARPTLFGPEDNLRFVQRESASPAFFTVLGVRPALGRFFTEEEGDYRNTDHVVVLGYALWQSDFGGDSSIAGRAIPIGSTRYTVVGVAPRGFTGANLDRVDIWLPLRMRTDAQARVWNNNHSSGPGTVARLRPGVSLEAAGIDATTAHRHTYNANEKDWAKGHVSVGPLHFGIRGTESDEARIAKWLLGLSVVVLLVSCANIMNLLLARATRRRRELAVRLALGAGRARLIRLLLTEAILLSFAGGIAAIGVATAIGGVVHRVLIPSADWNGGVVDSRVLAFTFVATLFTGLLLGVGPALRGRRASVVDALNSVRAGGGHRSATRNALTISQAALATLLLSGAALFVWSFEKVRTLDLGIQADRVVLISPSRRPMAEGVPPGEAARERTRREQFAEMALAQVRALPTVERAAIADGFPLGGNTSGLEVTVPGRDSLPRLQGDSRFTEFATVSPDYFATVGTNIVRGRSFTDEDRAGSVNVAIVNKAMADAVWPGSDPIGQCLIIKVRATGGECTTVVGVAADARRRGLKDPPSMFFYVPFGQLAARATGLRLLVRPRGHNAASAIPVLQQAVRALDPTIRYVNADLLEQRIDPDFRTWRVGALMFSLFAGLALVVAAVGLFSVVTYLVEQRHHEIGVRIALGASAGEVVALLLRSSVGTTLVGICLGGGLSFALSGVVQPLLFDTSARNPAVLGGVAIVLIATAMVASGVPALRARRIDPMIALRGD